MKNIFVIYSDTISILDLENKEAMKTERFDQLRKSAVKITNFIKKNQELFGVNLDLDWQRRAWQSYLKYVDDIIYQSVLQMIAASLGFFLDETDHRKNPAPLFDFKLVLCEPDIIFQPSVDTEIVGNFQDQIAGLLEDIFHMATLIPRVAERNDKNNYLGEY